VLRRILSLYPLLLAAAVWEAVARGGLVHPLFLPPLSVVLAGMPALLQEGDIAGPLLTSLYRAAAGLAIAMVAGLVTGLLVARVRWVRLLLGPLVAFGAPAPKIALLPVFIAWFGIGHFSKILLVAMTAVFPFIRVVCPAALPALLTGLRVAVPYALITAFTAEMIAGGGGLGGTLVMAQRYFETPTVFADILLMLAVGYVVDLGLVRLQRTITPWSEA
jgi:ABC-type nitrate/sulfonate/bicarbonate transport system permease component